MIFSYEHFFWYKFWAKKSLDLKDNFYYLCTSASNPIGQIHNGGGHVPFLYNFRRHFQFLVCIKSQYRF